MQRIPTNRTKKITFLKWDAKNIQIIVFRTNYKIDTKSTPHSLLPNLILRLDKGTRTMHEYMFLYVYKQYIIYFV